MAQTLEGSCHCGSVTFTVEAYAPVPYQVRHCLPTSLPDYDIIKLLTQLRCLGQLCMCSMCRKCGGTGGTVNLGAWSKTLKVTGRQHTTFVLRNRFLPAKGTARSLTITTLHLARTML